MLINKLACYFILARIARQIDMSQYYDDLVALQNHLEDMTITGNAFARYRGQLPVASSDDY